MSRREPRPRVSSHRSPVHGSRTTDNDYVLGVTENAFNLVKNLTSLCSSTKCDETFLLGSAALANLSFLSPLILTAMSQQRTVSILLQYLSHNVSPSIYIQDQVATVLANMAARHDTQEALLACNIVNVLLYLLAASPGEAKRTRSGQRT